MLFNVHNADTPDTDEGKLPEAAVADEWDITSPPIEQRTADASATVTSPEKKKKPRIRGLGTTCLSSFGSRRMHRHAYICCDMQQCVCI